jgi:hypothetical protein
MQRGLSGVFDHFRGEEVRGDTPRGCRGGGMGGYYREGYNKNPPVNYKGGGCMFDIYK